MVRVYDFAHLTWNYSDSNIKIQSILVKNKNFITLIKKPQGNSTRNHNLFPQNTINETKYIMKRTAELSDS